MTSKEEIQEKDKKDSQRLKTWAITGAIIMLLLAVWALTRPPVPNYDNFTQCLVEKDVKIYTAWWCPHCKDQKEAFGDSWVIMEKAKVDIECSLDRAQEFNNPICIDANITGVPTWEFADGSQLGGFVPFPLLAEKTGCVFP